MMIVNNKNFKEEVLESKVPVIIDFFAQWCGPCKMFGPIFESVAEDYEDKVKFVKVDIDESPEIAEKYFVMSIPTLKFINNGELKGSFVRAMAPDDLEEWVDERL